MDTHPHNTSTPVRKVRLTVDRTDNSLQEHVYTETNEEMKQKSTWYALGEVGEIGFVIAIPIVCGILFGSFLDKKFDVYPKLTLTGLFGGVIIAVMSAYYTIMDMFRKKR